MFHNKPIGNLAANEDIVIFSREQVSLMAEYLCCTDEQLIEQHQGIVCENIDFDNFRVQTIVAVSKSGDTQSVVVVGLDQEFLRFLRENETLFQEFLQNHPLFPEINWDDSLEKSEEIFNQIVDEYKKKNLEAS